MIAIGCENLSLAYGTDVILDKITFSLNEGEKLGIVGVNGAGKTTLLKLLTGEKQADEGKVYISKNLRIGVLDQRVGYESDKNIYDELVSAFIPPIGADANALEAAKGEYISRVRGFLKNLGFDEEQIHGMSVSALSGGQKTRIALAALLLKSYDVLMLDEPTNHLDISALSWLEEHLKNEAKTVIIISHDRYFLDKVTTKTLEIENNHSKMYNGSYSVYAEKKRVDREVQAKQYKDQQKEIARIEAYIANQRRWNRERNIIAAESREKQLAKLVRKERPEALPDKIKLSFQSAGRSGDDVLSVRNISKSYGEKNLFSDVSFEIGYKDRAFLFGENGCGKSTLIKIIAGRLSPDKGVIDCGYNVYMGYYDQENQELDGTNTVMDELWSVNESLAPGEIRSILARFLFRGDDCFKNVSDLSGGERARLTLAKLIMSKNNLLVLDEPTNHLDINSREALEEALRDYDGTLIAVSHDRYFISKLSNRILAFGAEEKGKIFDYRGSYDEFLNYRAQYMSAKEMGSEIKKETEAKSEYLKKKEEASAKRKLEHKIEVSKKEVERIEKRIEEIDTESASVAATDHKRLAELYEEKEALEEKLMELYEFLSQQAEM